MADQLDIYDRAIDQLGDAPEATPDMSPVAVPEPAAPVDPYAQAIDMLDADEQSATKQSILENGQSGIDPTRQAEALRLSKKHGVPVEVVYGDIDQFREKPGVDPDKILTDAPAFSRLLADPVKGPALFPEYDKFTDAEKALKELNDLKAYARKNDQPNLGWGMLTPEEGKAEQERMLQALAEERKVLEDTKARRENEAKERLAREAQMNQADIEFERARGIEIDRSPMSPWIQSDLENVGAAQSSLDSNERAAELYAKIAPTMTRLRDQVQRTVRGLGTALPSLAAGGIDQANAILTLLSEDDQPAQPAQTAGAPTPVDVVRNPFFGETSKFSSPGAYGQATSESSPAPAIPPEQFEKIRNVFAEMEQWVVDNVPVDRARDEDFVSKLNAGILSAGTFLAAGWAARALGVSSMATTAVLGSLAGAREGSKDAAANNATPNQQAWRTLIGGAASALEFIPPEKYLGWSNQAGGPFWQRLLTRVYEGIAVEGGTELVQGLPGDTYAKLTYDPERNIFANAWENFAVGGTVGAIFGAISAAGDSVVTRRKEALDRYADIAGSTNTAQVNGELLEEHLAEMKKAGTLPETVTAPVEAVEALFQTADPAMVSAEFPEIAQAIEEARASGSEVSIPSEKIAKLARLEGFKTFTENVRTDPDAPTVAEQKKLQEDIDRVLADMDLETASPASQTSPVFTTIQDQLVKAGQSADVAAPMAKLYEAFFTTQAQRIGMQPEDLLRRYGLEISSSEITGEPTPGGTQLDQSISVAPISIDPETTVPTVNLPGEVPETFDWRSEQDWIRSNLQGQSITGSDGVDVRISAISRKMSSSTANDPRRQVVLRNLPEVIRNAVVYSEMPDTEGRDNLSYVYAASSVNIAGKDYSVGLVYRKSGEGNRTAYQLMGYDVIPPGPQETSSAQTSDLVMPGGNSVLGGTSGTQTLQRTISQVVGDFKARPFPLFQSVAQGKAYPMAPKTEAQQGAAGTAQEGINRGPQAGPSSFDTTLYQGVVSDVVTRIRSVIQAARRASGHAAEKTDIAPVDQWLVDAAKENGLDIDGYRHTMDGSGVRHALKQHGNAKSEEARGQLAITDADLEAVPQVVTQPDQVVFGGVSRLGKPMVGYLKRMSDGTILYVEEARTGKRELALLSVWKYPGARDFSSLGTLLSNARSDTGDNLKIVVPPKNVNSTLEQTARGFITFNDARDKFRITLTGQANLSTFLHESGHFFLEVLQDIADRGIATDQQRQDLTALREWMGLDAGQKIGVPQHEKFARGFEAYLMEGKAPSAELTGVFQKFKSWLVFVYRSLAGLNVKLTDEVRGVMDRLLASDQAIQEARAQVGWRGQPMSQEATGLTDAEYQAYTEAWIKANDAQSQDADARVMLEAARELKKVWRDEKIAMTKAAEAELAKTRGYRAWKLLESGEGLESVRPAWSDMKIDPASIPSEWRRDAAGLTSAPTEGGLPLDDVAEILGFKSGEEMLSLIAGARAAQRAIPARVRGQMEAKHGKMDANALALEASKAVHNKPTMDVLLTEFRAMATKARQNTPKNISRILAAQAEAKVAELTQRQLEPVKWRRAELKAATEAGAASARGDATAAFLAKRRQMVAAHMHKATLDAIDRIEKVRDYLATFQTDRRRAQLGKAGGMYLDGVDQILEAIELKDVSLKLLKKRPMLQEIVEKAIAEDEPINIPPEVLGLGKKNYSQLTLGELEAVHDAVKNLWTLAKLKNELKTRQGKIAMDKAMAEIEKTANDYLGQKRQPDNLNPSAIDRAINSMRWVRAQLVKMEFLFGWLDGKPAGGLAHQLIYQPIADARAAEYKLMKDLTRRILDPIREMPREQRLRWDTKRQFMGQTMKGANIIAVALNLGNEQNKQKLLQGYNWNEQQLVAELNQYMTKADWDMVQRIWDAIESVWPHIERVSKNATGLAPPRVVPTSVQTPFGEYSGGYYPIVYDPFRTQRMAEKQEANAAANGLFTNNFLRPTLANGFTKKRTSYSAPIYLSLDVLSQHLAETVHYVTHYEAVKQADKIRSHPTFQRLVTETMGGEFWNEIRPWLQDIANNVTQRRYPELGESFWRRLRIGTSVASMGFNIGTGIQQLFGITTALDAIGPRYWATGVRKAWLSPKAAENWRFALKESQELEPLIRDFDREVKQVNDAYTTSIGKNAVASVAQAAFWHIGHLQLVVNVATWHGAYEQAIAEGKSHAEAVTLADSAVRKTQSAGAIKDLADVQRSGEATKLLTMFYSYFSVLYNRLEDIAKETKSIKDVPRAAMRVALLSVVPAMLNIAYKSAYAALTADEEDEEEEDAPGLATRIGLESVNQLIGAVPLLRNLISFGEFGGTNVPALNKLQQMERAATALKDWAVEGETPTRNEIRTTVNVISTLTQTPIYPIYKQLDDLFGEKISDALE